MANENEQMKILPTNSFGSSTRGGGLFSFPRLPPFLAQAVAAFDALVDPSQLLLRKTTHGAPEALFQIPELVRDLGWQDRIGCVIDISNRITKRVAGIVTRVFFVLHIWTLPANTG